ncbi:unnamed protein product [Meganyctiphanes norvegica]|uniref:GCN5-related N-acetyltransferase Rv2170-like domain-containing protein n=1 Tax=Meganyctiphanes norvegica TaxID=48144 RepID=A0AAV2Q2H0_MEGNR
MCSETDSFVQVKDLQEFANRIKGDMPYSASLYNSLLIHGRGYSSQYEFYTLRGTPEDSHILMSKDKDPNSHTVMSMFHCLPEEAPLLLQALDETQLVKWHKNIIFIAVPDFLLQELRQILQVKADAPTIEHSDNVYIYTPGAEVKCPAEFCVEKLGNAGLHKMFNAWPHSIHFDISLYSSIVKSGLGFGVYCSHLSSSRIPEVDKLPTADDTDVPVAWITLCPYGQVGLLETEEGYRRQGLGGLVTQVSAQMLDREGFIAHAMVDEDNETSQRMFQKLGWRVGFICTVLKTKKKVKDQILI